jgi:hypothetical protein
MSAGLADALGSLSPSDHTRVYRDNAALAADSPVSHPERPGMNVDMGTIRRPRPEARLTSKIGLGSVVR